MTSKYLTNQHKQYADKAANTGKFTIITKSNSMRSSKDKQNKL